MTEAAEAIVQALLLLAVVMAVTAAGFKLVRMWRDRSDRDDVSSHQIMTNFRELHAQGGLSDEEYRTIKAKLASGVKEEFSEKGNAG